MALALQTVRKYFPKVQEVVDATETMELNVLEEDCKYGIEGDPRSCAFARAAQRNHNGALVGINTCYVVDGKLAVRFRHEYSKLLKSFDKGTETLSPGVIKLKPFTKGQKLGISHSKRNTTVSGKKRAFHHAVAQEDRTGVRVL